MPLRWSIKDCENWKELHELKKDPNNPRSEEKARLRAFVSVIVENTMAVGINNITEDNFREFYRRQKFCSDLGVLVSRIVSSDDDGITRTEPSLSEVRRCIGLSTNASEKSRDKFLKDVYSRYRNKYGNSEPDELNLEAPDDKHFNEDVIEQ